MNFCLFSSKGCQIIDAFLWLFLLGKRTGLSELRIFLLKFAMEITSSPSLISREMRKEMWNNSKSLLKKPSFKETSGGFSCCVSVGTWIQRTLYSVLTWSWKFAFPTWVLLTSAESKLNFLREDFWSLKDQSSRECNRWTASVLLPLRDSQITAFFSHLEDPVHCQ